MTPIANANETVTCHQFHGGRGRGVSGRAVDISDLAAYMESWTDRPLVDQTGIKGLYRIDTGPWLPMSIGLLAVQPGMKQDGVEMSELPTIYTVFESLGLRMKPQKGNVDVYVIDHVERPSEN